MRRSTQDLMGNEIKMNELVLWLKQINSRNAMKAILGRVVGFEKYGVLIQCEDSVHYVGNVLRINSLKSIDTLL